MIYNFSILDAQYILITTTVVFRKTKMSPLNITFIQKFLERIAIKSMKSLFLQKYLTRKMIKIYSSSQI